MGGFPGAYAKPTGTPWAGYLEREGPASAGGEARGGRGVYGTMYNVCANVRVCNVTDTVHAATVYVRSVRDVRQHDTNNMLKAAPRRCPPRSR